MQVMFAQFRILMEVCWLNPSSNGDLKFLKVLGFGKREDEWITEYDSWPIRLGFLAFYILVGRGGVLTPLCGKHKKYTKCGDVGSHHGVFEGKDIYHNVCFGCHSPTCSRCWKWDWAVIAARNIESRFLTAEKVLGLPCSSVEHLQVSVPKDLYSLALSPFGYKVVTTRAIGAAKASGGLGGCMIWHPFRKDRVARDLVYGFHFHLLTYLNGGYECRSCEHLKCSSRMRLYCDAPVGSCDGFEQVTRRAHVDDGWIVSLAKNELGVVEKRKSLFGTSWYQLEHSGLQQGVRNFHIIKWWGNLANKKLKTVKSLVSSECPECGGFMGDTFLPDGVESFPANRGEKGFLKNFTVEHVDDEDFRR